MDQTQTVGLLSIADQAVGTVGFQPSVVVRADGGQQSRIVGVAVGAALQDVVDLEPSGRGAARRAAGAVAAADVALDVGGECRPRPLRRTSGAVGVPPGAADLEVRAQGDDGLVGDRDALDLGR